MAGARTSATSSSVRARIPRIDDPRSAGVLTCQVRVQAAANTELRAITVAHPGLRLEVLDRLEVGRRRVLLLVRIISEEKGDWADELRRSQGVRDVVLLHAFGSSKTYRVLFTGRTFVPLARRLRVTRQFPFSTERGVSTWSIVARRSKVRRFLRQLEVMRVPFEVASIRRDPCLSAPYSLTNRQWDILLRAIAAGYFDVPRKVSLSALAPKIGVAVSTLSVTLAVIEKKVIEASLWAGTPSFGSAADRAALASATSPTFDTAG